jgi:hypothetical protein
VQIEDALKRLGILALQHGESVELLAVGGAVLLRELIGECGDDQEVCWAMTEPFVVPSQALKARYAFLDLWESIYGNN